MSFLLAPRTNLYAKRQGVYPKAVNGRFRRLKWAAMVVAVALYWGIPWLRWNRGPFVPDQAVLVDLAHRRFYMFGIEIWPQEFYYVAGLLVMAGIGLFLVTSAVGRAWCGYSCPQTVWTDLFQHVDRLIDGDRNAQMRLARAPWGVAKLARRAFKYGVYLAISFCTGGAWIFYFADAPTLQHAFWTGQAAPVAYATTAILTATTFILGGLMREQVCIYMCPWPRIQTAMLDERSLIVTYKDWRGEPRSHGMKKEDNPALVGDCVDCLQCVAVCPTGIDIRNGPQIGCITCALCIDACDAVMEKIGRPRGLIDYCTSEDAELERRGLPSRPVLATLFRPRTLAYFGAWGAVGIAMLFAVSVRTHIGLGVVQDRNPLFVRLSDGSIRNSFTLKLRNMEARPRRLAIGVAGLPGARLWSDEGAAPLTVPVPADSVAKVHLFVATAAAGPQRQPIRFTITALDREGGTASDIVPFERPEVP